MAVDTETTADNIVTVMEAMTTPLFDEVWLGGPQMLPMGDQIVGTVQAAEDVNFTDNVCPTHYDFQTMFYVYIEVAGTVNVATKQMLSAKHDVIGAFKATPTFNGSCLGSTITGVKYGEMTGSEPKRLTAVARIDLLCNYSY